MPTRSRTTRRSSGIGPSSCSRRHAREHPDRLFKLLRTVKPVLLRHNLAIVTRYHDVDEVLGHDEAFSVQPYREKMVRLAGDFILGTDDSPQYERDISILRLAAPRSDVPALAGFVDETAEALVAAAPAAGSTSPTSPSACPRGCSGAGSARPGPDEDTLMAWTLAIFEDIFVNVKNDPAICARGRRRVEGAGGLPRRGDRRPQGAGQRRPADRRGRPAAGHAGDRADGVQRRGDPRQRDRAGVRVRPDDRDRDDVRRSTRCSSGPRRWPAPRRRRGRTTTTRCGRTCSRRCGSRPRARACSAARARTSRSPRARCTRRDPRGDADLRRHPVGDARRRRGRRPRRVPARPPGPPLPALRHRAAPVLRPLRQRDADPPDRQGRAAPARARPRARATTVGSSRTGRSRSRSC